METLGEILGLVWWLITFVFSMIWSLVWFILRDLISTLVWAGLVVWIVLALRYRSAVQGAMAMVRYARSGLAYGWRWARGQPADAPVQVKREVRVERIRYVPIGYVSVSAQMNATLVLMLVLMGHM
ncbi:MAG: hypothetical protein ACLFPA_06870 [Dichotomicrobium sp.]